MSYSDSDFSQSPALARVARGNLCAGCGGCALVADGKINMKMQDPGYLRPVQTAPLTAREESRISRICPGLGQSVAARGRTDDVLWGPYVSMQTGWAKDADLRHTASSGGALSAVLNHLLAAGTVDQVIQTAASPQVPVANAAVLSRSAADVRAAAGSRYAPSAPLAGIAPLLDSGKRFAFVGKPCDVAALRALALEDTRVDQRIPVMLSFFCAGVPSQHGAEQLLRKLGTTLDETSTFRYRGNGWPGYATATLKDGREASISYHESWGKVLTSHVQLRCKICADGTGQAADIVCADAWETDERGYPLFEEEDGISLIVARTQKGQTILQDSKAAGHLVTNSFDVPKLADIQPGQSERRRVLAARLLGLQLLARPSPTYRGLHVIAAARQNRFSVLLKNVLGILHRGLRGRLD